MPTFSCAPHPADVRTSGTERNEDEEAERKERMAGQGNSDPVVSHFNQHFLVKYAGRYYDPSYAQRFNTLQEWQDGSLAGVGVRYPLVDDEYFEGGPPRPNHLEVQEEIYE
ncbi:MAG: hypothetical protein LBN38_03360 [Verrucomicrobiota bacterium]|jgi:hypothetical protein|nr:hypothetical protein [Verrucomicrobiota bacterium]